MNLVLLDPSAYDDVQDLYRIQEPRQIEHIKHHLKAKIGDTLKVGVLNQARYLCEIIAITDDFIELKTIQKEPVPDKIPVTLIVALPRPKALRRLIMDATSLGVEKIVLMHCYHVEKSYWQTPFLQKLNDYAMLGLEQAGDVFLPEIVLEQRFKPFVEDRLRLWTQAKPSFVAHPYSVQKLPMSFNQPCQIIVGAERGFTAYEIDLLQQNGCQICQLGNRILRTETAVSSILARMFT
ncbi:MULTISPECIES: 16S rRNA (uracil(1498)-N(3))-methyltransferase [unclassified Acinetobacter]|uniref:16S rRNA (uracil(1498)-N(3))-methyltransferase n=1 Tax=unclassified Acinetobacter TaxID=196816 RepID=UPI0035B99416